MRPLAFVLLFVSLTLPGAAGGKTEAAVPPTLAPASIAFWDAHHGLIGTGLGFCGYGHCWGGTISLTTDGGRTSRVLRHTSGPVSWLALSPGGFAWALVDRCSAVHGCVAGRLLRTRDGGRSWQLLPRAVLSPRFADSSNGLAISNGSCFYAWCFQARLLATHDGGQSWRRLRSPCGGSEEGVSLVSPRRAWLLCTTQPGAGNQGKAIYRTLDGGRRWQRVLSVEMGGRSGGGISSYGYALGISFSTSGVGVLWEGRGTLYVTRDGGHNWQPQTSVAQPELDFGASASVVPGRAYALLSRGSGLYRLVATTPSSVRWQTVRTWKVKLTR